MGDIEIGSPAPPAPAGAWARYYNAKAESTSAPSTSVTSPSLNEGFPPVHEPSRSSNFREAQAHSYSSETHHLIDHSPRHLLKPLASPRERSFLHDSEGTPKESMAMDPDTYSLLVLRLAEQWSSTDSWWTPTVRWLHLFHALVLYFMNVVVQVLIVCFIWQASEDLVEKWDGAKFERKYNTTLSEAAEQLALSAKMRAPMGTTALDLSLLELCAEQLLVPHVALYYVMIFLWVIFQLKEFKKIRDWLTAMYNLPGPVQDYDKPLVLAGDGDFSCAICFMTCWQKAIVFLAVPAAKFAIVLPTTFIGAKFLALQTLPFALVMKAVGLQMILNIDDIFVSALALRVIVARLQKAKIEYPMPEASFVFWWYDGVGSLCFLSSCIAFVCWLMQDYFADLTFLRTSCRVYHSQFSPSEVPRVTEGITYVMGFLEM